jgi:hypothetical protein
LPIPPLVIGATMARPVTALKRSGDTIIHSDDLGLFLSGGRVEVNMPDLAALHSSDQFAAK